MHRLGGCQAEVGVFAMHVKMSLRGRLALPLVLAASLTAALLTASPAAARPTVQVHVSGVVALRAHGSSVVVGSAVLCTGYLHEAYVTVTDESGTETLASEEIFVRPDECAGDWVRFRTPLQLSRPAHPGEPLIASFNLLVCGPQLCFGEHRSRPATARVTDRWDRPSVRFGEASFEIRPDTTNAFGEPGVLVEYVCTSDHPLEFGALVGQRLNPGTVQVAPLTSTPSACDGSAHRQFLTSYRGAFVRGLGFVVADLLVCASPGDGDCRKIKATRQVTFDVEPAPTGDGSWGAATTRASVDSAENEGKKASSEPDLSRNGRYVAFTSRAPNLVRNDTNGADDVFVRDRLTGATRRVSVGANGQQADGDSTTPAISATGRYVAFVSNATNLTPPGGGAETSNVYVHDRASGRTELASVGANGQPGNGFAIYTAISADGNVVAFTSTATNLVSGDENGQGDVFVRDRREDTTALVSVDSAGAQADGFSGDPAISADGRLVAFRSDATTLVPGDDNGLSDIFVHQLADRTTRRVSVSSNEAESASDSYDPDISGNGRYVTFLSFDDGLADGDANLLGDVVVRDRWRGTTELVSATADGRQGNAGSFEGRISATGRYVVFYSQASNLVPNDTNNVYDCFVHDLATGVTQRANLGPRSREADAPPDDLAGGPAIADDGTHVAFPSEATNLVPNDTNSATDIFVRDRAED